MSFIVTARKWRPQTFNEVVGQEHITTTLINSIKNNRIAHAYLFTGPRGVGKTTTARILAKALNCLNPKNYEPCNECEMCTAIQANQSMDIIEIDGASNRGIDEVRTLRDSVKYAPSKGKYKIYIIDEVHMLTKESFNAFLKTLEEPPAHIIFVFATTDIHKVPLTIISRCQRFDFRRIQLDTIKSLLQRIADSEKIHIDDKTLTLIAKKADGALRDAESYFDQAVAFCGNTIDSETVSKMMNLIDDEVYFTLSDAVLEKNFSAVYDVSGMIYENGWNYIDFMEGLIEHFRNIMTVVLTGGTQLIEAAEVYRNRYAGYHDKFSEGDILRILNFLNKTQQEFRYAQNQRLKIEIALSHLIGLEKSATISQIISTINSSSPQSNASYISEPEKLSHKPQQQFKVDVHGSSVQSPAVKPVLPEPIKSKPVQNTPKEVNLDAVIEKWDGFVKMILTEKGLLLGPLFRTSKPFDLTGTKLSILSNSDSGLESLEMNKDYISRITQQYFGKRLTFHLELDHTSKKETQVEQKEDDPYIEAIKKELGGEQISK